MSPLFEHLFAESLTKGFSVEEALGILKSSGATPVETIKAIAITQGISLSEAKAVFGNSTTWTIMSVNANALHDEVLAMPHDRSLGNTKR
jgi:ribosomal protein L7/L12